jgi:hypothetical protein
LVVGLGVEMRSKLVGYRCASVEFAPFYARFTRGAVAPCRARCRKEWFHVKHLASAGQAV